MQSSPPMRAWDRVEPPSPANDSQYSLDLGPLDLDGLSGTSSPVAKLHFDRVFSEDIDGPSDFTLNMEKWMRGGTLAKGKGTVRSQLGSIRERIQQDESTQQANDQDLEIPQSPQLHDEEITESHHTPSDSPPRESVFGTSMRDAKVADTRGEDDEHASSSWDPYGQGSTPQPPAHNHFLQPTVEDYHSEQTPARGLSAQRPDSVKMTDTLPRGRRLSPRQSEPSSPGRPSSPTLSPVRSPLIQRSMQQTIESSPMTEPVLDRQMQQLQAKCQQLEHLNSALKQALDEEQRIRKQENAVYKEQIAHAARRERELKDASDDTVNRLRTLKSEHGEQKKRLELVEAQALAERSERDRLKDAHAAEMRAAEGQRQRQEEEHSLKVRDLENDLQATRYARNDAEEAARLHREELDEYRDSHEAELERLRLALGDARDVQIAVAELEIQLKKSKDETANLQAAKDGAEDVTSNIRAELATTKQIQQDETVRLTADHLRAVELAEGLQKKLKDLQQQLRDQHTAHQSEIEQLRSAQDSGVAAELDTLRTEHEAQQSLLNSPVLERDAVQDEFTALQSELKALKADLADKASVEKAFDARISDSIQKREAYWREKLRASEKERRVMAKALLHQWGREEVGVEVPQGFEYKFATRKAGLQAEV